MGVLDPVIDGYGRWTQCESSPKGSGSIRITIKCKRCNKQAQINNQWGFVIAEFT